MTVAKWVFTTYLMLHIQKTNLTYLWLFAPLNDLMCGHWTSGVVIELLCRCWTNKKALLWNSSFKSCMIQRKIKTSFEIESQMTLDVVKLRQFRIYGTRVQRFSHVLVKLIRYYDWYRLIVDFHKKSQRRDIFLVPVTCYVKHSLKSLFYVDRKYFFKRYISGFNSIL